MQWYKLDNAAKLFPSVTGVKNTSVFRVSAVLEEPVNAVLLQRSVDALFDRFPMFIVRLRRGIFWNYLDPNDMKLKVEEEKRYPCCEIHQRENNGYLIKVLFYRNRVSVEVFHSLTDGGGAFEFLKSLLYQYYLFCGEKLEPEGKVLLASQPVTTADFEDAFYRYYEPVKFQGKPSPSSYKINGTHFECYGNNVLHGVVSASKLNAVAKQNGGTITAYLCALLMHSIYQTRLKYDKSPKPITVSVPVNLRRIFPSRTLRNFFGVVNISAYAAESADFAQLVQKVSEALKNKTQRESLQQLLSNNYKLEKSKAARFVPLVIKNLFVNAGFRLMGESRKTITLSNLGRVEVPQGLFGHIRQLEAVLYPSRTSPINCGVCSVGDNLVISFTRTIEESDILQYFFTYLAEQAGLQTVVYSNDWGADHDNL